MNAIDHFGLGATRARTAEADLSTPTGCGDCAYTLRRSGSRPLSFRGRHVGFAAAHRAGAPIWHELNLYETEDGRFVTDIRALGSGARTMDQYYVAVVDRLDEAIDVFESYDVRFDVPIEFDPADPTLAPAELMVHASTLKCRLADAVSQYQAVLAAFLYQIGNG
jgi:hypothetical protein